MLKLITNLSWRRWCSGIMQDSHSCAPGSIPGRRTEIYIYCQGLANGAPPGQYVNLPSRESVECHFDLMFHRYIYFKVI